MGFFIGFVLVTGAINLRRWIQSHTWHEMRWQECPICRGTGKTPNERAMLCMTCIGQGGWAVTTKRWLTTTHSDRPLD